MAASARKGISSKEILSRSSAIGITDAKVDVRQKSDNRLGQALMDCPGDRRDSKSSSCVGSSLEVKEIRKVVKDCKGLDQ